MGLYTFLYENLLYRLYIIAPPPSHLSAGGRRGRPSYQKNGRARNRQRPLAAIVCLRAHDKTLKVLEGSSGFERKPASRKAGFELSSSGSLATRRLLAPSWPCRVLLLAVAVLRTVRHVLRIGQDVRSTLRRLQHRRRRSSTHSVTLV